MRSDEIYVLALDSEAAVSGIFSKKENARTADLCIAFMESVAGTSSVEDIRAARQDIQRLQDHVLAANEAVADRVRENPQVLSSFVNGLHTLFRLLLEADPTIRVVAGFASEHKGVVRSVLLAFLTDLCHQLEAAEGKRASRLAVGAEAVFNGLGTLIGSQMTGAESVETLTGPRSEQKRDQVRRVILHLAASKSPVSIIDACRATFKPVEGGYATDHELYVWCHRNEARILRMADELRQF